MNNDTRTIQGMADRLKEQGFDTFESCVIFTVKGDITSVTCSLRGNEMHLSPSVLRIVLAMHNLLDNDLKFADMLARTMKRLGRVEETVNRVNYNGSGELDQATKDVIDEALKKAFGSGKDDV